MPRQVNYLVGGNPFKLSGPPLWWLKKLYEFDNSLVVVPSQQGQYYRLAQRRPLNLPAHIVNDLLFKDSDTRMLASHSLIPVTTILATAQWDNPYLFVELANRAPWRMGGAAKAIKIVEDQEFDAHLRTLKQTDENLTDRTKDGWKRLQSITGQRQFIDSTKVKALIKEPSPLILP